MAVKVLDTLGEGRRYPASFGRLSDVRERFADLVRAPAESFPLHKGRWRKCQTDPDTVLDSPSGILVHRLTLTPIDLEFGQFQDNAIQGSKIEAEKLTISTTTSK
jgi:hypothetical protein